MCKIILFKIILFILCLIYKHSNEIVLYTNRAHTHIEQNQKNKKIQNICINVQVVLAPADELRKLRIIEQDLY